MVNVESEDDYTYIEYYDEEMTDEKKVDFDQDGKQFEQHNKRLKNSTRSVISAVTVEDDEPDTDDEDEYTYEYEEDIILDAIMENDHRKRHMNRNRYMDDSTAVPLPLPAYRATTTGPDNTSPAISTPKEASTSTATSTFTLTIPRKPPPVVQASTSPTTRRVNDAVITPRSKNVTKEEDDGPIHLSASKKRASAANSVGLSELSKQLRILQAKNESQAVDNHRLERQLRILADLQGISVGELRRALEDACASEAFGELQNRVSKLKYELEAATLAKQVELRKDATAPHIANLELRVGELEEVEEKQMTEIRNLYEELRQERAKSMRFESENQQLKMALQDMINRLQSETARSAQLETNFQKQIQQLRERQSKKMQEEAEQSHDMLNSVGNSAREGAGNSSAMVSPEMAAEYEQMVQLLKEKDTQLRDTQAKLHANEIKRAEKLIKAEERAREVQMDMKWSGPAGRGRNGHEVVRTGGGRSKWT